MKTKFSDKGNYVICIRGLNENEKIDFNKIYTFYIYHYKTKSSYNEFVELIKSELEFDEILDANAAKEVCCDDILPPKAKNIMYVDLDNNKVLNESTDNEKKNQKTKKKAASKFYLTIIENENIDDAFFFGKEYMQTTYEFDTKEELNSFINQEKRNKGPFESVKTILPEAKQKNVTYVLEKGVNKKILEHEFILNSNDFEEGDRTIITFWPSMDAYMVDCHEDRVLEGVCGLPEMVKGEMDINNIFFAIEDNMSFSQLKHQYIGKMTSFDFEDDSEIPKCLVSNYLCANYITDKESLEYLNKIRNLELAYNSALNDKCCVKEFLMMMHIIDEKGKVLAPFDGVIYEDGTKNKGTAKTNKKCTN